MIKWSTRKQNDGLLDVHTAAERAKRYGINEEKFKDMLNRYDADEDLLQG